VLDARTGKFTYISGACVDVMGWTAEEILELKLSDFMPAKAEQYVSNIFQNVVGSYLSEGKTDTAIFENQQYNKNGDQIWVEITVKVLPDEDPNAPINLLGTVRLIEDRKQMELAIKESEAQIRLITQSMGDIIVIFDATTAGFNYASGACMEVLGYSAEELLDIKLPDIMSPYYEQVALGQVSDLVTEYLAGNTNKINVFEVQETRKDGKLVWVEITAKVLPNEDSNAPLELLTTTRLIEDRKQMELAVKESERKYRLVTDNMSDVIWVFDYETRKFISLWGACYETLGGYSAEELLEIGLENLTTPESRALIAKTFEGLVERYLAGDKTDPISIIEIQHKKKDGSFVWLETVNQVFPNKDPDAPIELFGSIRLIEERKKMDLALKESERKYRLVAENMSDVIWVFDYEGGKFVSLWGACEETFGGWSAEEIITLGTDKITPPQYLLNASNTFKGLVDRYLAGDKTDSIVILEFQHNDKLGNFIWLESTNRVFPNKDPNAPIELLGSVRLIEDRKKMELAVKESEAKHRLVTDSMSDIVWIFDYETSRFTYMSGACVDTIGWAAEEIVTMSLSDFLPPDQERIILNVFESLTTKYLAGERTYETILFELHQYHKNGSMIWVEVTTKILPQEDEDAPVQLLGTVRLIEDRKQMELIITESEQKHRLLAENMKDTIWMMDLRTLRYTYRSESCKEITGYTPEESLALTVNDVFPPEAQEYITYILDKGLKRYYAGESDIPQHTFELQQYHKDGSLIWIEISGKMMPNANGVLTTMVGSTRRIDDRKEAEFRILKQQRELEHANATKNRFFSIISHDLKNPLGASLNTTGYLKESYSKLSADRVTRYIDMIHKASEQTFELLEKLLEWARSSMDSMKYEPQDTNINELIKGTVKAIEAGASVKGIGITVKRQTKSMMVFCDRYMTETVVRNLITNALKFSNSGSKIKVAVDNYAAEPNYFVVSIKDSGVGMPPEKLNKLFKLEEKSVSTKGTNNETGTGLGLMLCKEFIDRHNCRIWVESEENVGTTFYFTLPKAANYQMQHTA
jgi:PAS domain S-box-containing protein